MMSGIRRARRRWIWSLRRSLRFFRRRLKLVLRRIDDKASDDVVEVVVLDLERLQALADLGFSSSVG